MATTDRVRFTISCDSEVYEAFAGLAEASGVSLSRCIGDWLRDTAEAAQITTIKVNEVRKSPSDAFAVFIREAVVPESMRVGALYKASRKGRSGGLRSAAEREEAEPPRPVIRGGKSPVKTLNPGGSQS
jgi:hypothetical protein